MNNIIKISPNKYALLNKDRVISSFYKIERVDDNSHYYCLWPNSEYFHLYHTAKEKYTPNCNTISAANKFTKIEHYSKDTGTFVAYRKDKDYAHIMYEDGYAESTVFSFVGQETNRTRPVKTCSERWFFYNTEKRKYLSLTGKNGFQLDGHLEAILTNNIFIIYKNYQGKQLVFYNKGEAPIYSRDYFDYIEPVNDSTFIGKLYNRNLYCIIKTNNIAYPIGYYSNSPKYIREHNLYIALKGNYYCLVKGNKEIQNHHWKNGSFIFHSNYVFNKQEDSSTWKIFNANDGHEIPTNFKNIRVINDKELYLFVNIDGTDKRVSIKEIENLSKSFIDQIQLSNELKEHKTAKIEDKLPNCEIGKIKNVEENKPIITSNSTDTKQNESKKKVSNDNNKIEISQYQYTNILKARLYSNISYYVFVSSIKIVGSHLISDVSCNCFRGTTFVIWFISKNNTMAITESRRSQIHTILYLKENSQTVSKIHEYKPFWNKRIVYPIDIQNTIAQLNPNSLELELYKILKEKLNLENYTKNISSPKIHKTKHIKVDNNIKENKCYIECNFIKNKGLESIYQEFISGFKKDKNENIENLFFKRKFVYGKPTNYICILFDSTTDSFVSIENNMYYFIYGEGKDKKFDHYFGANANSIIRDSIKDNQKKTLLFKSDNNKISLFDEIKCENYSIIPERESNRNVIIFKFKSLLKYTNTDISNQEKEEKNETIIQDVDAENDEIDKPSKVTNMSKLEELYETEEKLLNLGIEPNEEFEKQFAPLEEESIRNEIVPQITQAIEPILKSVKRKFVLVVEYDPQEGIYAHLS